MNMEKTSVKFLFLCGSLIFSVMADIYTDICSECEERDGGSYCKSCISRNEELSIYPENRMVLSTSGAYGCSVCVTVLPKEDNGYEEDVAHCQKCIICNSVYDCFKPFFSNKCPELIPQDASTAVRDCPPCQVPNSTQVSPSLDTDEDMSRTSTSSSKSPETVYIKESNKDSYVGAYIGTALGGAVLGSILSSFACICLRTRIYIAQERKPESGAHQNENRSHTENCLSKRLEQGHFNSKSAMYSEIEDEKKLMKMSHVTHMKEQRELNESRPKIEAVYSNLHENNLMNRSEYYDHTGSAPSTSQTQSDVINDDYHHVRPSLFQRERGGVYADVMLQTGRSDTCTSSHGDGENLTTSNNCVSESAEYFVLEKRAIHSSQS